MNKKFIVTQNKAVANQLIAAGFTLVSNMGEIYSFLNEAPKNFNFESVSKKDIAYTNILNI